MKSKSSTISATNGMQDFFKKSAKKQEEAKAKSLARKIRNKTPLVAQFMAACGRFNVSDKKSIATKYREQITAEVINTDDDLLTYMIAKEEATHKVKSDLTDGRGAYKIARAELGAGSRYAKIIGFAFLKYKNGNTSISQLQSEAMLSSDDLRHFTSLL